MLKCPKCDADWWNLELEDYGYVCEKCGHIIRWDDKYYKEFKLKQRTDKVLEKFKQVGLFNHLYICKGFTFNYNNHSKQFTLFRAVLEIDTMEKLIRDLESDK